MSRNPPGSPWRSTPRAARKRKPLALTLSPEALEALEALAKGGSRSAVVERLILSAVKRPE